MKASPILFSPPMIRPIVREIEAPGTGKSQTRRLLDHACDEPPAFILNGEVTGSDEDGRWYRWPRTHAIGDLLWIREPWRTYALLDRIAPRDLYSPGSNGAGVLFEADDGGLAITLAGERWTGKREDRRPFGKLRPGMFLPRWASRITAIVTNVRVERLKSISWDDAVAEGAQPNDAGLIRSADGGPPMTAVAWFRQVWEGINGPSSWDANPWIVAYSFRPIPANVVDVLADPDAYGIKLKGKIDEA